MSELLEWLQQGPCMQLGPIDSEYLRLSAERYAQSTLVGARMQLRGYVGESNELRLRPRGVLRATARSPRGLLEQLAAALATGNTMAIDDAPLAEALEAALPPALRRSCHGDAASSEAVLIDPADAAQNPNWPPPAAPRACGRRGSHRSHSCVAEDGYVLERLLVEQTA